MEGAEAEESIWEEKDLWDEEEDFAEEPNLTGVSFFEGEEEYATEVSIFRPLIVLAGEADFREDLIGKSERECVEVDDVKFGFEPLECFLMPGIGMATGAEVGCPACACAVPPRGALLALERACWSRLELECARF